MITPCSMSQSSHMYDSVLPRFLYTSQPPVMVQQQHQDETISTQARLAHFMTSMVLLLWRSLSVERSHPTYTSFYTFVSSVLSCTSNNMTPPVLMTALKYIHSLRQATLKVIVPGQKSEYRIFVTALILADAVLNDNAFTCKSWEKVTRFSALECAAMKKEFLQTLAYDLTLSPEDYKQWLVYLDAVSHENAVKLNASAQIRRNQQELVEQQRQQQQQLLILHQQQELEKQKQFLAATSGYLLGSMALSPPPSPLSIHGSQVMAPALLTVSTPSPAPLHPAYAVTCLPSSTAANTTTAAVAAAIAASSVMSQQSSLVLTRNGVPRGHTRSLSLEKSGSLVSTLMAQRQGQPYPLRPTTPPHVMSLHAQQQQQQHMLLHHPTPLYHRPSGLVSGSTSPSSAALYRSVVANIGSDGQIHYAALS